MALTEAEELELLELENENSNVQSQLPTDQLSGKPSLARRGVELIKGAGRGIKNVATSIRDEPVASIGGALTGGFKGIGKTGASLIPAPSEEDSNRLPEKMTPTVNEPSLTSLDIRGGSFRPPISTEQKPMTEEEKAAFETLEPVGEFGVKTGLGLAATTLAPGGAALGTAGKIGLTLAKGGLANTPFAASAFEEGGTEGLLKDFAINTGIDILTLGIAKSVPALKKFLFKKAVSIGKKISENAADRLAKEMFGKAAEGAPKIKDIPLHKSAEKIATEKAEDALKRQPFGPNAGDTQRLDALIDEGISKGVKPTVVNKTSFKKSKEFFNKAKNAVKTISENKDNIILTNDVGEAIPYPKSASDMANAIEQSKKIVYSQYHKLTQEAGQKGAEFNLGNVNKQLDKFISSKGRSQGIRDYAQKVKDEVADLAGESPAIIEERIKELNSSLAGFYEGRVVKAKAQIDASVANSMREELDNIISNATGTQYAPIKAKYGELLSIEKEVNKRAIVNARKANKGLLDMTDIFTGGDIAAGLLTANPALLAKGTVGKGLKEVFKKLNDPDRAIAKMFKESYKHVDDFNNRLLRETSNKNSLNSLNFGGAL